MPIWSTPETSIICFRMLAQVVRETTLIVTAVAPSKTFNIPGLNLSALIVPDPECREALIRIFDTMHVSASNPFSIAAFEAAYQEGDAWLDELLIYLQETRDFVARLPGSPSYGNPAYRTGGHLSALARLSCA